MLPAQPLKAGSQSKQVASERGKAFSSTAITQELVETKDRAKRE